MQSQYIRQYDHRKKADLSGSARRRLVTTETRVQFEASVLSSKETQPVSMTTISWLMLSRKIFAVYSENHKKPTNTICEQNAELLIVKTGGTYSYHWVLKGHCHLVHVGKCVFPCRHRINTASVYWREERGEDRQQWSGCSATASQRRVGRRGGGIENCSLLQTDWLTGRSATYNNHLITAARYMVARSVGTHTMPQLLQPLQVNTVKVS
jgi:hypothetical protein